MATSDSSDIVRLAELVAARNAWESEVSTIIGRPALIGNIGEYVAACIFGIRLNESASHKANDGEFVAGPLAGRAVNIKWYSKQEGILDLAPGHPDFYLVLAGPKPQTRPLGEHNRPWLIDAVFLFSSSRLLEQLKQVKLDITISLGQELWTEAMLYPEQRSPDYLLSEHQRNLLRLFGRGGNGHA